MSGKDPARVPEGGGLVREEEIGERREETMKRGKVVLGGDPEFELVRGGWTAGVAELLGAEVELPWGAIGREGDVLELRPRPSPKPETLVRNVGHLLLMVLRVVGGVPSTVCRWYPLGGHLHIGGVPEGAREDVAKAVDGALGDLFHSLNTVARLQADYGRRGDWRPQPWGVEYRTPPSSVWSHPMVALAFLRGVKWLAERVLSGEDPFGHPAWPFVRANAEKAAEFVRAHGGKLHLRAWKEHVGEFDLREGLEIEVALRPKTEFAGTLIEELWALFARLGIPSVEILPLDRAQGDHASNVPGYGKPAEGLEPYRPSGPLALSWRFRNDPSFREKEMPKLERAIAQLLERLEEGGGDFVVKEVLPFSVDWPPEVETEEGEGEDWAPEKEEYACDSCGAQVPYLELHRAEEGRAYCRECYEEEYASCGGCGRTVRRGEAHHDRNRRPYCERCYYDLHVICSVCGEEVPVDEARLDEVGEAYCEACYGDRYTSCEGCGREVAWDEVEEHEDLPYCPSCYASLLDSSEEEEEVVSQE